MWVAEDLLIRLHFVRDIEIDEPARRADPRALDDLCAGRRVLDHRVERDEVEAELETPGLQRLHCSVSLIPVARILASAQLISVGRVQSH